MKRILSLLLVFISVFALLVGCGGEDKTPVDNNDEQNNNVEEKIDEIQYYNITLAEEPGTLNYLTNSTAAGGTILTNIMEPLVRTEFDKIVPSGCEKWEVSEDGLTWTFYLRDNKWSDGVAVTAENYAYTLRMCATPSTGYPYAADMYVIKNFEAVVTGEKDISELGVKVLDDKTLEIQLEYVCPSLLQSLSFQPLRQDNLEKWGDRYGSEAETMVCCGPFVLTEWTHQSALKLTKNENYWDADTVKLQNATFNIVTEEIARYNMLENGSLDALAVSDPDYVEKFRARDDMDARQYVFARTVMSNFNFNDPVFANVNIRKAISLAFPREESAEYLYNGINIPAYGLLPPPMVENNTVIRDAIGDPLKKMVEETTDCKAILVQGLKELGLDEDPSKFEFELYISGTSSKSHTMGEYFQQVLQDKLGCKVNLRFDEYAIFAKNCSSGDFQMGFLSWGSTADATYMINLFKSDSKSLPGFYSDAEYDAKAKALAQELDYEKRLEMFVELDNKIICEDFVVCPIVYGGNLTFRYNYVHGVDEGTFSSAGLKYVYTQGRP